jgi:hypothetical protein
MLRAHALLLGLFISSIHAFGINTLPSLNVQRCQLSLSGTPRHSPTPPVRLTMTHEQKKTRETPKLAVLAATMTAVAFCPSPVKAAEEIITVKIPHIPLVRHASRRYCEPIPNHIIMQWIGLTFSSHTYFLSGRRFIK